MEKGKEKNPLDALRRKERLKEKLKNKEDRQKARENAALTADPAKIREKMRTYERLKSAGQLDNAGQKSLEMLTKQLKMCLEKRAELDAVKAAHQDTTVSGAEFLNRGYESDSDASVISDEEDEEGDEEEEEKEKGPTGAGAVGLCVNEDRFVPGFEGGIAFDELPSGRPDDVKELQEEEVEVEAGAGAGAALQGRAGGAPPVPVESVAARDLAPLLVPQPPPHGAPPPTYPPPGFAPYPYPYPYPGVAPGYPPYPYPYPPPGSIPMAPYAHGALPPWAAHGHPHPYPYPYPHPHAGPNGMGVMPGGYGYPPHPHPHGYPPHPHPIPHQYGYPTPLPVPTPGTKRGRVEGTEFDSGQWGAEPVRNTHAGRGYGDRRGRGGGGGGRRGRDREHEAVDEYEAMAGSEDPLMRAYAGSGRVTKAAGEREAAEARAREVERERGTEAIGPTGIGPTGPPAPVPRAKIDPAVRSLVPSALARKGGAGSVRTEAPPSHPSVPALVGHAKGWASTVPAPMGARVLRPGTGPLPAPAPVPAPTVSAQQAVSVSAAYDSFMSEIAGFMK